MDRVRYKYKPLRTPNTIRLLTIYPGRQINPLIGGLETAPSYSAGPYEALSYVWAENGPPDLPYEMFIVNDQGIAELMVLRGGSIFAALRRLRLPDRPRRIWADQCCNNQDDAAERSQQIQLMSRIYQGAIQVVVWLGLDPTNEAESAFSLVRELDRALNSGSHPGSTEASRKAHLEAHITKNCKALRSLTTCKWFKRGWIVQEIGTGSPATLTWGCATLDWATLASVCEGLKSRHQLRATLAITTSDISFLYQRFIEPDERTHHANRFNFVYELQRSRHLQFSDNRDRVYAFLGHFSAHSLHPLSSGPVSIVPNYTQSVEQVYINVAKQILQTKPAAVQYFGDKIPLKRLRPSEAGTAPEKLVNSKASLPSWVPDWRYGEGIILAEPISPHFAHGHSTAEVKFAGYDDLRLKIRGVEIDAVHACSQPLRAQDLYGTNKPDQPHAVLQELWDGLFAGRPFNLADIYLNGQSAFFAFMQTLNNGCVQAAGHMGLLYHTIGDDMWLRKAAQHVVERFGAAKALSKALSKDVEEAAAGAVSTSHSENWSRWAASAVEGRLFAKTKQDYYVLGPMALEPGDRICVFFVCKVPFCLRPEGGYYTLVGECYVHGLMKGEAMGMLKRNEVCEKKFSIV